MYSQAIAGAETDHTLFGNRSAAYLALGLYEGALQDAQKAVALCPTWAKAHYRCEPKGASQGIWSEGYNMQPTFPAKTALPFIEACESLTPDGMADFGASKPKS